MKRYGLVIATKQELEGVLEALGKVEKRVQGAFDLYFVKRESCEIIVCFSGPGEISSAAATQMLITGYGVEAVLNFGFAGALDNSLGYMETLIVKDVCHYDFDLSQLEELEVGRYFGYPEAAVKPVGDLVERAVENFPSVKLVRLASGDKFIASEEKKQWLVDTFSADVCDMEGAGVVLTANKNGIPSLLLKIVSDHADEAGAETYRVTEERGTRGCAAILNRIIDEISG